MLMAVGITVSAALTINKKREPLHLSFAALCLAITFHKGGSFNQFFQQSAWLFIERLGLSPSLRSRSNSVLDSSVSRPCHTA